MRTKFILILAVWLVGLWAGCGMKKEEDPPAKIPTVHGVKVEIVKSFPVEEVYEAVGTIRSKTTSVLSSRIMGSILAVHVREGDRVQAGQLLVEIDDREAAVQLRKAQAGLRETQDMLEEVERNIRAAEAAKSGAEAKQTLAASTFNRYQALFERQSVSPQEFEEIQARQRNASAEAQRAKEVLHSLLARKEQVRSRIEHARAEIANAQIRSGYARILSPGQGLITAKQAEVGILASPGAPLLTVEDDVHYRLEVAVEESKIGKIRQGGPVRVRIDALGQGEWTGRVAEIVPVADPASRSLIVKIDLPQNEGKPGSRQVFRSGFFGKALFGIGPRQALTIPEKAVIQRGELQEVYVVDQTNIVQLRLVKTGKLFGDRVEVLAGIRDGERIIGEGVERVSEGSRVE